MSLVSLPASPLLLLNARTVTCWWPLKAWPELACLLFFFFSFIHSLSHLFIYLLNVYFNTKPRFAKPRDTVVNKSDPGLAFIRLIALGEDRFEQELILKETFN